MTGYLHFLNEGKGMDEIKAGMTIGIEGQYVEIIKVSRKGMSGVMDGSRKVGDPGAIAPVYYYKKADKTKGHVDAVISP